MAQNNLNTIYNTLVSRVYEDDMQSQRYYLSVIETMRHIPVSYLIDRGFLFIPNNEYIYHYLGNDSYSYGCGLYYSDRCLWTLFYLIPIVDLTKEVVGLVGWDAQNKMLEISGEAVGLPMYKVSSKNIFSREKYFLTDVDVLKKTFDTRTIFVTDGVFDSVALNYRGIPAIALLGSTFSPEVLYFLRWYRAVYVVADNDDAGTKLYKSLKRALPKVRRVVQDRTKDIEELLRDESPNREITKQFFDLMESSFVDDYFIRLQN